MLESIPANNQLTTGEVDELVGNGLTAVLSLKEGMVARAREIADLAKLVSQGELDEEILESAQDFEEVERRCAKGQIDLAVKRMVDIVKTTLADKSDKMLSKVDHALRSTIEGMWERGPQALNSKTW